MKIKNEDVTIRIGNKEKSFKNLILNNYIELFRDSFLEFKNKNLEYCFIKFNATQEITEESTTMDYDIILGSDFNKIQQTYAGNTITNKYTYNQEFVNGKDITDTIKKAGNLLNIKLIDHLIIGKNDYFSFYDYLKGGVINE